jgi:hypothetical protein
LERLLQQAKYRNPRHFMIRGPRGGGKTSLLAYTKSMAVGETPLPSGGSLRFRCISIALDDTDTATDILGKLANNLTPIVDAQKWFGAYRRQAWELFQTLETWFWRFKDAAHTPIYEIQEQLARSLFHIDRALGRSEDGLLLLIDEADRPAPEADLGAWLKGLSEHLTRLGRNRVLIGVAGVDGESGIVSKFHASHESSLRAFQSIPLGPLTEIEQRTALQRAFELARALGRDDVFLTESGTRWIIGLTGGDPARLQELAYGAFELDSDGHVDMADVLAAAFADGRANVHLDNAQLSFMPLNKVSPNAYGAVLRPLLRGGEPMSLDELKETTHLSRSHLARTIQSLVECDLLAETDEEPRKLRLAAS